MFTVNWPKLGFGAVGALVTSLWASLEFTVQILLGLMALDLLTGLLAAFVERKLDSKIGWQGLAKKVATLLIIAAVHIAEPLLGGADASLAVAGFYCAVEMLSIIENGGRAGAPVPSVLKQAVVVLKEKLDQNLGL